MRNLGGAIGIAASGTLLNSRVNLHFLRLAEHLNSANASMVGLLQRIEAHNSVVDGGALNGHAAALKTLWAVTMREAQTQTFADIFAVIALCFVAAMLLVPAMRKVQSQVPVVSAESH